MGSRATGDGPQATSDRPRATGEGVESGTAPLTQAAPAQPHVVVIGGGFGGLRAAQVLRGRPVQVTLVDRYNHHVFQPLLYQVATAGLSPAEIAAPIRWVLRRARNVRVLLGEVTSIDPGAKRIQIAGGATLSYDYLIVSPGARHGYFGHPEWEAHAPGLKTLGDALEVRRRVLLAFEEAERETDPVRREALLTFVIVGGGPTGVELAGTLAEITRHTLRHEFRTIDTARARIVIVEAGPSVLGTFVPSLRDSARASLRAIGIEVHEGTRVVGIDATGVDIQEGARPPVRVTAGTVVWAAGVFASPLVRTLGVPLDGAGRVIVEPDLSVPGHPDVWVVGDAARVAQPDGSILPGVVQPATQGAEHAARSILRRIAGRPTERFVYRDLGSMAIVGRGSAIADLGWLRLTGFPGWLAWLFLHLVKLVGFRSRVLVLVEWAAAYLTFQRSARLITDLAPSSGLRAPGSGP
jgi:NADH:ubiquinone reductase (H+-translocating)